MREINYLVKQTDILSIFLISLFENEQAELFLVN